MKLSLIIVLSLLVFPLSNAQTIKETSFDAAIGFGYTFPYDDVDLSGSGLYAQGEYVLTFASWIDVRPYAGLILTSTDDFKNYETLPDYEVSTTAFLFGGKVRIKAPIPWVAPFIEIGVGGSVGSFRTFTPFTDTVNKGFLVHVPWSLGLEIGRRHNFTVALSYYEHPSAEQVTGSFAVGYSFPLGAK